MASGNPSKRPKPAQVARLVFLKLTVPAHIIAVYIDLLVIQGWGMRLKFWESGLNMAGIRSPEAATDETGELDSKVYSRWEDIGRASAAWKITEGATGGPYDEFRGKYLPLPQWFDHTIDPLSPAYVEQQDRLWQMMVGDKAAYDPANDEISGSGGQNVLVHPGLYSDAPEQAGNHLIAMGHILKVSGLKPGDRVLEYGAGFGQIALAMARLGIIVDTVDIDPFFCESVQKQADWFGVPLKSHLGRFGDNPTGERYDMIMFYECFHHARDFVDVILKARDILKPGGKIIMAGEPIHPSIDEGFAKTCPFPWGIRLEVDCAAIVRFRRWYELGFKEEFLLDLFDSFGFIPKKHDGHISHYATVYTFTLRDGPTKLAQWTASEETLSGWHHPEAAGRWTKGNAVFPLERRPDWTKVRLTCVNHHLVPVTVMFGEGAATRSVEFGAGERRDTVIDRPAERILKIGCRPVKPSSYGAPDDRDLGIFIEEVEYLS